MASIVEKRQCLHRSLVNEKEQNGILKLQVSQLQALANIGATTCMIAHEINNLLTPIANYAALALQHPDDLALTEKALQKTALNAQRACDVASSIMAMVNKQTQEKENILLIDLVREIFSCLARDFSKDQITVKMAIPDDLEISVIPIQIQQTLMNLILNAREAMLPNGGVLTITAGSTDDIIHIEITDTGSGIDSVNLAKIFEPFFTTKSRNNSSAQKSGNGLGLAFCKKVTDDHDGSIAVESKPNEKTKFSITLPKFG